MTTTGKFICLPFSANFSPNPTVINAMQKATLGRDLKRPTEAITAKSEKLAENSIDDAEPVAVID